MNGAGFHAGEQAMQARVGLRERLAAVAPQILRDHMPDQHRELFGKLPTLLLGALDEAGQPWATMLAGPPGFVTTPDARRMRIDAARRAGDPALAGLREGAPVGLLGLEPHTRRRNRMNGVVEQWPDGGALEIAVRQSFGNCPRYIVPREPEHLGGSPQAAQPLGPQLDEAALALISGSDTLFIASASARPGSEERSEGVDVSHRGGAPGFVAIEQEAGELVLILPDYPGNQFFMTLGNLSVNPAAGLLWLDHHDGTLLQVAARAELRLDGEQRSVRLRVRGGVRQPAALPWRWHSLTAS